MGIDLPCDGKCEVCKYDDCILTEEQVEAWENEDDISARLSDYYKTRNTTLEKHRKYNKEVYYPKHKEEVKARVYAHRKANREHYREYERNRKRIRDRKEYQHQYYLKKKGEKNVNKENVSVGSNNLIDNGNNSST